MNLTSPQDIKALCQRYGIKPSKYRGQNFTADPRIPRMMADAADVKKDDVVLEVGPGFGSLTQELAKRVKRVIAVEFDRRMVEALKETLQGYPNIEVQAGDILKVPSSRFHVSSFKYKVVANLPYSITSAILRKFTSEEPKPELLAVMVQHEVAERVVARPGAMSLLSVALQFYGKPEIVAKVSKNSFWPVPKVDSAILKITTRIDADQSGLPRIDERKFFTIVRLGFSSRRKQLANNLTAGLKIPKERVTAVLVRVGLDPRIRAQDLSLDNWKELTPQITNGMVKV